MTRTMMMAAFALATAGAMPATAQMTTPSTTGGQTDTTMGSPTGTQTTPTTDPMSGSGMNGMNGMDHGTNASSTHKMTRSQTAAWKKCQAMPEARMMKNKSCVKMSKMQDGMTGAM